MVYTTLTLNSTTLYTYENIKLIHVLNNINCSEIVSQELGLINASTTLVGCIPIATSKISSNSLALYFMKKVLPNSDGSKDLVTVISIAYTSANKTLVLSVLKKIMDRYIVFKRELDEVSDRTPEQTRSKLGEFKLYMKQIINQEELNYERNRNMYNYGSTEEYRDNGDVGPSSNVIGPLQLLLANEEVGEVRQLMLDNISRILNRGDKISLLVDQTDRLTYSSDVFKKKAKQIRKNMWWKKTKFYFIVVSIFLFVIYILTGSMCGFPTFDHCFHS